MSSITETFDYWENYATDCIPKTYLPGDVIWREGEEAKLLCLQKSGIVKSFSYLSDGTEKIYFFLKGPNINRENAIVEDKPYASNLVAVTKVEIFWMPSEVAMTKICNDKKFLALIIKTLHQKMKYLANQCKTNCMNIERRLAEVLLYHQQYGVTSNEESQKIQLTHADIASLISSSRETVTMWLNIFEEKSYVKKGRGYIIVTDIEGLEKILLNL